MKNVRSVVVGMIKQSVLKQVKKGGGWEQRQNSIDSFSFWCGKDNNFM